MGDGPSTHSVIPSGLVVFVFILFVWGGVFVWCRCLNTVCMGSVPFVMCVPVIFVFLCWCCFSVSCVSVVQWVGMLGV